MYATVRRYEGVSDPSEALVLGSKAGVSSEKILEVLSGGVCQMFEALMARERSGWDHSALLTFIEELARHEIA